MSATTAAATATAATLPLPSFAEIGSIDNEVTYDDIAVYFTTNGSGRHGTAVKHIRVLKIALSLLVDDNNVNAKWGELQVYFAPESWNVEADNLIYTDKAFLECTRKHLVEHFSSIVGEFSLMPTECLEYDLDYSEYGMQGQDFVHFDLTVKQVPK